jgi:hypothetical protein
MNELFNSLNIKSFLRISDDSDDQFLHLAFHAAIERLNQYLNINLLKTSVTKTYSPNNNITIIEKPLHRIISVKIDNYTLSQGEYYLNDNILIILIPVQSCVDVAYEYGVFDELPHLIKLGLLELIGCFYEQQYDKIESILKQFDHLKHYKL